MQAVTVSDFWPLIFITLMNNATILYNYSHCSSIAQQSEKRQCFFAETPGFLWFFGSFTGCIRLSRRFLLLFLLPEAVQSGKG